MVNSNVIEEFSNVEESSNIEDLNNTEGSIIVDTSLLIDFFRKKNKEHTILFELKKQYHLTISVITVFEFKVGSTQNSIEEIALMLQDFDTLPLDVAAIEESVIIYQNLKRRNLRIGLADTLIAATAIANNLPLATLNREHFSRIDLLSLLNLPEIE